MRSHSSGHSAKGVDAPPAVRVVGLLRHQLGIGEVARGILDAARFGGLTAYAVPLSASAVPSAVGYAFDDYPRPAPVGNHLNIICVNPPELAAMRSAVGRRLLRSYSVGYWWWETENTPPSWEGEMAWFDEIWAGSEFVASALLEPARKHGISVRIVPPALRLGVPEPPRVRAPTSASPFTFLFAFDFLSAFERKNPIAVVEAFKLAFPTEDDVALVIKTSNEFTDPVSGQRLRSVCDDPRITLVSDYLSDDDRLTLFRSCDAYVSLHRSEGLGLTLLEASMLGKPVICSDYGGSKDFATESTAFLVPCGSRPIGAGNSPYAPDSNWADPSVLVAAKHMRSLVATPALGRARVAAAQQLIENRYSVSTVATELVLWANSERPPTRTRPSEWRSSDGRAVRQINSASAVSRDALGRTARWARANRRGVEHG
jgi:glycosyltransferase involved in cell wall biosynthesis